MGGVGSSSFRVFRSGANPQCPPKHACGRTGVHIHQPAKFTNETLGLLNDGQYSSVMHNRLHATG